MSVRVALWHATLGSLALLGMGLSSASAQTLQERRLGLINGTAKGVVVYEFGKKPQAPASAANNATAQAAGAGQAGAATQPAPAEASNAIAPPSGRSLNEARRHGGGGIAVTTARTASQPAAKP